MFIQPNEFMEGSIGSFADPIRVGNRVGYEMGNATWVPGKSLTTVTGQGMSALGPMAMGMGSLGLNLGVGIMFNGWIGGAAGLASDIGTSYAMSGYHFQPGLANTLDGKVIRPGLVTTNMASGVDWLTKGTRFEQNWAKNITKSSLLTQAGHTAAYSARYLGGGLGGAIGATALGRLGGAIAGTPGELSGNITGGYLGARLGVAVISNAGLIMSNPFTAAAAAGVIGAGLTAGAMAGLAGAGMYGGYKTLEAGYNYRQMQKQINTSGSLAAFSTSGAHTMRARAVQAMHKSHLNARSALGQEASLLSMPQRNYGSKYRKFY
jgi:hypothetical protein